MVSNHRKKWELDTNVVLDLGRKVDAAFSLIEVSFEKGYSVHTTPTVIGELARLTQSDDQEIRNLATISLSKLPEHRILPLEIGPGAEAIAEEFSRLLRHSRLLPEKEVNDGIILAEASLGGAALLASSDSHLISIDPEDLWVCFQARDLTPIPVMTPRKVLRIFERIDRTPGRY